MTIDLDQAEITATALASIAEIDRSLNSTDGNSATVACSNCSAPLQGKYCHACGQSGHIHRSLLHMFEEVLHGIFHFDTKAWRTIPALIFRPGKLTKEYIEGKRTSYVSPLALFLFLIFLMFFVFSLTIKEVDKDLLTNADSRENITKEITSMTEALALQEKTQAEQAKDNESKLEGLAEIHESQIALRELQEKLDKLDGKSRTIKQYQDELTLSERNLVGLTKELQQLKEQSASSPALSDSKISTTEQLISFANSDIAYFKKKIAKLEKEQKGKAEKEALKSSIKKSIGSPENRETTKPANKLDIKAGSNGADATVDADVTDISGIPWLEKMVSHFESNKALTLYKMKKNASSYAFLLMPISLPFLWLLFMFRRKFVMFDHAVFSLYSLSFMCILLMIVAILSKFEFMAIASILFAFVPPIHMFSQLRGAYSLGILATLWRTVALLFIAMMSLLLYAILITVLSA